MEVFLDLFGKRRAIFLDEIQYVKGWELFINRLLREGYTVYITGSSANLLSKELGTHLTGRHTDLELYPFSFFEFLTAKGLNQIDWTTSPRKEESMLKRCFGNTCIVAECLRQ